MFLSIVMVVWIGMWSIFLSCERVGNCGVICGRVVRRIVCMNEQEESVGS